MSKARYLNTAWVLQWLDDIGLPQYKDPFLQAAVNGILLHRLTKDDFITMQNGNSDLHFSSLRYGIKVNYCNWLLEIISVHYMSCIGIKD